MSLGGFHFSRGIDSGARLKASAAAHKAGAAESEVFELRNEVERLLMITEALWTFLKQQHGYSDEDLIKQIAEIDIRDGKLDGKVAPHMEQTPLCPKCQRPIGRKRPNCLYCGAALVRDPFER